jgi:hypothetical protein
MDELSDHKNGISGRGGSQSKTLCRARGAREISNARIPTAKAPIRFAQSRGDVEKTAWVIETSPAWVRLWAWRGKSGVFRSSGDAGLLADALAFGTFAPHCL